MSVVLVDLWCDGSGTTLGNPGGWGVVLVVGDVGRCRAVSGASMDSTNNRMELGAFINGLKLLTKPSVVCVHTDSEYLMNPFEKDWISGWRRKNWHKVKNPDLWQEAVAAAEPHMLSFEWHRGHSGVTLNEVCDKIAGSARRSGEGIDTGLIALDDLGASVERALSGDLHTVYVPPAIAAVTPAPPRAGCQSCEEGLPGIFCPVCQQIKAVA